MRTRRREKNTEFNMVQPTANERLTSMGETEKNHYDQRRLQGPTSTEYYASPITSDDRAYYISICI